MTHRGDHSSVVQVLAAGSAVKVIGFRCAKTSVSWAVVEGDSRASAVVAERKVVTAPHDTREAQLAWVSLDPWTNPGEVYGR
jgi:hypothetical protein